MKLFIENLIRFLLLVFVQVFILDNIQYLGYINPMIYVLFILSLPIHLNTNIALLLAFILGLTIDSFGNTLGMHTFSIVLIAFIRKPVIKLFLDTEETINTTPTIQLLGAISYLKYVTVLVLIHQTALFMIESFSFYSINMLLIKIALSSLISIILIFIIQSLNIVRSSLN